MMQESFQFQLELKYFEQLCLKEYKIWILDALKNYQFALASDKHLQFMFDFFLIDKKGGSKHKYLKRHHLKIWKFKTFIHLFSKQQRFVFIILSFTSLFIFFFLLKKKKRNANSEIINGDFKIQPPNDSLQPHEPLLQINHKQDNYDQIQPLNDFLPSKPHKPLPQINNNQDNCDQIQPPNDSLPQNSNESLPQINHSINNNVLKRVILSQNSQDVLKHIIENQRAIEEQYKFYVRPELSFQELCQEYSIKNLLTKKELKTICDAMIPVRGDGNCFYTAFAYQYFKLIVNDQHLLKGFETKYSNIKLQIRKEDELLIDGQEIEKEFLSQFFTILKFMSLIADQIERNKKFFEYFSAHNEENYLSGFLNPLSVIFLRNLCFKFVMESDDYRDIVFDKENLLIWEKECNNNEPIILLLAQKLNVHIKLIFFDDGNFKLNEYYSKENQNTIILLIRPGHYNIGVYSNN